MRTGLYNGAAPEPGNEQTGAVAEAVLEMHRQSENAIWCESEDRTISTVCWSQDEEHLFADSNVYMITVTIMCVSEAFERLLVRNLVREISGCDLLHGVITFWQRPDGLDQQLFQQRRFDIRECLNGLPVNNRRLFFNLSQECRAFVCQGQADGSTVFLAPTSMNQPALLAFFDEQSHIWLVQTENAGELYLLYAGVSTNHGQDSMPRRRKAGSTEFGVKRLEAFLLKGSDQKSQRIFDL